ncbi:MAG: MGMT family protein [Clostridiaceae bacterium]|jgi:methylated-DNA-protein-cysteine methyltransferase-like protein|nr:MGMT family protein [Clostridiaceae bacterium]
MSDKGEGFFKQVYEIVARIPEGKVATYGGIGRMLGSPRGARIVGWAMRGAPKGMNLPCHRVVKATGELSPSYVFGDSEIQRAMLSSEGITFREDGTIDMERHLWKGLT